MILGVLRSQGARAALTNESTARGAGDAPSHRVNAGADRVESNNGGRWYILGDGTVVISTAEAQKPLKVVVGERDFVRVSRGKVKEGELEETGAVDERLLNGLAVQDWWNVEVQPLLVGLQANMNTLAGALGAARQAAQAAGPEAGNAFALSLVASTQSIAGTLDAMPMFNNGLVAGLFRIANTTIDEE